MEKPDKLKNEISKHVRVLKDKLNKFLSEDKPPDVLIIKAHLICEYYIDQILVLEDICPVKDMRRLAFSQKLEKVEDKLSEVQKESLNALRTLNTLRNKVGHELEYTLSEFDVDSLGFFRGKDYVLEKYDFEDLSESLRNTLTHIVVDSALLVFTIVDVKKNKPEQGSK